MTKSTVDRVDPRERVPVLSSEEPPFSEVGPLDSVIDHLGHLETKDAVHRFFRATGGTPQHRGHFEDALAALNKGAEEDQSGAVVRSDGSTVLVSAPTLKGLDFVTNAILLAGSATGMHLAVPAHAQAAMFRSYLT